MHHTAMKRREEGRRNRDPNKYVATLLTIVHLFPFLGYSLSFDPPLSPFFLCYPSSAALPLFSQNFFWLSVLLLLVFCCYASRASATRHADLLVSRTLHESEPRYQICNWQVSLPAVYCIQLG
jgi:hypothetical protein